MRRPIVLSTRDIHPVDVEQAAARGLDLHIQPFIQVRPILTKEKIAEVQGWMKSGVKHIVFTSANACTPFDRYLTDGNIYLSWRAEVFCLSGKTFQSLPGRILNHGPLATAPDAASLAHKILAHDVKEVLFFCGNRRREELPRILKDGGVTVHEVVVYETLDAPEAVATAPDAVLFFSPSAVQSFFSVNSVPRNTALFAIGSTTAAAIADYSDNRIITAESANETSMMEAVHLYFDNINCYE